MSKIWNQWKDRAFRAEARISSMQIEIADLKAGCTPTECPSCGFQGYYAPADYSKLKTKISALEDLMRKKDEALVFCIGLNLEMEERRKEALALKLDEKTQ